MAVRSDVVVIGGGLAGMFSALQVKEQCPDAGVRLISKDRSSLRSASGFIDVLGYVESMQEPVVNPFDHIPHLDARHPYRKVGVEGVKNALDFFDSVVEDYGGDARRNSLVTTNSGVKPSFRYPSEASSGLLTRDGDLLLVGFDSVLDFDAPLLAEIMERSGSPFNVRGVTLELPVAPGLGLTGLARLFEEDQEFRNEVLGLVEEELDGEERIGFPAVLGIDDVDEVRGYFEGGLGVEVFEVPTPPPSLLGVRLEETLRWKLESMGVRVTTGHPVVDYESSGGGLDRVFVERYGELYGYAAEEFVLATGGLVGGGVDSSREWVYEPVFGCHVPCPGDRYDWFDADAFGPHRFPCFGVVVDSELRPLDQDGDVEFDNLRAAGGVVGGYDFVREKSGAGVSIATGYCAGELAGENL